MGSYRSADNPDRIKAAAGVALVHVALAALILSGLTVTTIVRKADALKVFDVRELVAPPPAEPPPQPRSAPKEQAAPAAPRSTPTDIVAPRHVSLPVPLPLSAAAAAGQGSASAAGAAGRGAGSGAGGQGSGSGGGGSGGDGQGFTPARLLNKIPDADYRQITASRIPRGSATIALRVNPDGSPSNCQVLRSSGDSTVDRIVCDIATRRLRFSPARDAQGRAIGQQIVYTPTWRPN